MMIILRPKRSLEQQIFNDIAKLVPYFAMYWNSFFVEKFSSLVERDARSPISDRFTFSTSTRARAPASKAAKISSTRFGN